MYKIFLILLIGFIAVSGCGKNKQELLTTSVTGKFVGVGCWPVIQIDNPENRLSDNSFWQSGQGDTIFKNCVGVLNLKDGYKDGRKFNFTISKLDSNIISTANCTIPKYSITIGNYLDSSGNPIN